MANLQDNIRVSTQVDMQQLDELILKYKDLKIRVSDVAAASRAISEQMKRDALEQANATKQATLELQRQQAAVKAVSNELIQEEKVVQQIAKTTESTSRAKTANIQRELAERRNLIDSLTAEDRVAQQVSITASQAAKAKTAAYNQETAAARALLAEEKILEQIERTGIAQKNNATAAIRTNTAAINQDTAAIRQDITSRQLGTATITQGTAIIKQGTAAIQQEKESVRLSTEQQRLYNQQLRNKALESKNASDASSSLFNSLNSLTKLRSELITLFGAYSIGSFAQQMVEAQSRVESFQLSMKNLLGQGYGTKLTNDLKAFTVNTPLNFEEVIKATNTLVGSFKAAGASSKTIATEIPQILESLGNSAAALGGGDRLGRLTYAFSQVQAVGRLMGTEVRQITETGFPLLAVMAQQTGKSVQELQKDISNGKVGFEQFKEAILSAGKEGEVFAGSMDIMANTVQGRIDKLKEQVFFALSNIGNEFNDSAKRAIDFGASIVQALFGTEEATKRTISVVKSAAEAYLVYQVAVQGAALKTALVTAYERAALISKGLLIRTQALLTGSSIALTEALAAERIAMGANTTAVEVMTLAEAEAVVATNSLKTSLGAIALVLGIAYVAYEAYQSSVDDSNKKQEEFNKKIAEGLAPIKESYLDFNRLSTAVLNNGDAAEKNKIKFDALKSTYPELLKGVKTLSDAEAILGEKANDTNIVKNYRLKLLKELQAKYPDQLKGITNLDEAERKLGKVIMDTNADFMIRQNLMKNEIALNMNREKVNVWLKEQIELEGKLATASKQRVRSVDSFGNMNFYASEYDQIQKDIAARERWILNAQKTNSEIVSYMEDRTKKLKYEWDKQTKDADGAGKEQKEKALKYQNDTDKQKAILQEVNSLREQQETRDNQQKILDLERYYEQLKIDNAKGSQEQKEKAIQEIEKKYRKDKANLTKEWDKKDLDASKKFWEELEKEQKKSDEDRIKFSETIDKADEKRKNDLLENQAKRTKKALKDEKEANEFRVKLQLEAIDLENKLAEVESKRYDRILDFISASAGETKELFNLNDAIRKSADARQDLINKQKLLLDITMRGNLESKEGLKAQKEVDEAKVKSVETSNALTLTSYQLLYKAIETIFNGIKNSIANSMNLVADSYRESNKIFQEFVVKKREADLKNYEDDLKTRLKLAEGNFDVQLKLLDEYLTKAEQLMDERSIIDKFASDLEYLNTLGAEKNEQAAKMLQELSLNPLNNIKSMFSNTLAAIGRASDGLSKEQEKIYRQTISNSQNVVDKLEWQRDNTVDILEQMIDAYRDKYSEQTKIVKDETDKQIDIINSGLDANLDKLSSFYDSQGDIIRTKYGDILDNNVRYTDTAFEKQLAIWNSSRVAQEDQLQTMEQVIKNSRDREINIQKEKYEAGTITLEEYLFQTQKINKTYGDQLIQYRTKFYDDLQAKTNEYYDNEKKDLDQRLASGLLTQEQYSKELGILDDIQKQRSKDIKSIVTKDRDEELAYLKTFYYDAKVLEEQRASDAILKINTESATKLAGLQTGLATTIAGIEKQKRDTILSYNSQIFEENRKLALAEAEISKAQGKAAAWKNPFTAKATIKNIEEAFNEIITQILSAVNPFAAQRLNDNIIDNQVPVVTDGSIFFEKGTDNTSKDLKGKVVDNKGGKVAVLHPEEAVFSKANMSEMTKALGYRPSRDEVIEKFKMGIVNMKLSHSPYVIPKLEAKGIGNVDKVVSELKSVANEMRRIQTPQVIMNERGIKTYLIGVNSKVQAKLDRFK